MSIIADNVELIKLIAEGVRISPDTKVSLTLSGRERYDKLVAQSDRDSVADSEFWSLLMCGYAVGGKGEGFIPQDSVVASAAFSKDVSASAILGASVFDEPDIGAALDYREKVLAEWIGYFVVMGYARLIE